MDSMDTTLEFVLATQQNGVEFSERESAQRVSVAIRPLVHGFRPTRRVLFVSTRTFSHGRFVADDEDEAREGDLDRFFAQL